MQKRNEHFREMQGSRMHSFGPSVNRRANSLKSILSAELTQQIILELLTGHGIFVRMGGIRNQIAIRTFWCDTGELETNSLWNANTVPGIIPWKNTIHKLFAWHARTGLKIIFGIRGAKCFGVWGNGCGKWYSAWWAAKRAFSAWCAMTAKIPSSKSGKEFFWEVRNKEPRWWGFSTFISPD